eukprot:Sspe_Gene.77225::Locus_48241_Transcript_1_1_Confidence_1.000_Length_818::g.77225::m.77225/K03671/trxA; thioredoxin 1
MPTTVRSDTEFNSALASAKGKSVLIDFYAEWCPPCQKIAPEVDSLARNNPNIVFLKVDVDHCSSSMRTYGVTAMPTFVGLDTTHAEVARLKGADSEGLAKLVARLPAERFVGEGRSLKSESSGQGGGLSEQCRAQTPPPPSGATVSMQIVAPDGQAHKMVYPASTTVLQLYGYVKYALKPAGPFKLLSGFPQKPLSDGSKTLQECGLDRAQVRMSV